jgi:predicted nucleic-acid-binding protein
VIALDTNVLVRFLVEDEPEQAARARALVKAAVARDEPLFLSTVVMSELAWVLDRAYGFDREQIAAAVEALLAAPPFAVERAESVEAALLAYRRGRAGLPDYLIRQVAIEMGCRSTVTFDRQLVREAGFERP